MNGARSHLRQQGSRDTGQLGHQGQMTPMARAKVKGANKMWIYPNADNTE